MTDVQGDTTEVDDEYLETIDIHGRDFQKYSIDHNVHLVPVDEGEAERLEHQHRVFNIVFDDRLIFPPVTNPRQVLDCGYGTASWAIDVAETFPDCEVTGVDISPHLKPDDTPENFWPQLDDLNRAFTFNANTFDLVHSRMVGGGINATRWTSYLQDIKSLIRTRSAGSCYNLCEHFTDLKTASDPRQNRIGIANRGNVRAILNSLAIAPFIRRLGMSANAVDNLVERASDDADNPALKAYFPL
ncbi:MAG: hypothetical protein Q9164_004887 [Protoblastenia rupestris]